MNHCAVCGIEISGKAKTCSPRCRKLLSRQVSVTGNVSVTSPKEPSVTFEFYTQTIERKTELGKVPGENSKIRKAKYWYDVPIAAIPVIKKGWPEQPDYMNGRQYFLWWQNEFKMNEKNPESPEILNPLPAYDKLEYVKAGEGSRHWGTV